LVAIIFAAGCAPKDATVEGGSERQNNESATPGAQRASADDDWAVYQQALDAKLPDDFIRTQEKPDSARLVQWRRERDQQAFSTGLVFIHNHPEDQRRWAAVLDLIGLAARLNKPETGETAVQEHQQAELEFLRVELENAPDATPEQQERAAVIGVEQVIYKRDSLLWDSASQDAREAAVRQLETLATRFPAGRFVTSAHGRFLDSLASALPGEVMPLLRRWTESANASVRKAAKGRMMIENARNVPLVMKFTAIDGRQVDLANLRGKVVLIDFWATWCGPCVDELPNLRSVYEEYQDRGFEVIGVSGDAANDRTKLIDFIARNEVTWPQYFDGEGMEGEYFARYDISGLPATFLLDRTGKLVATGLRGDRLKENVERWLAAPYEDRSQ
jgi:thiol-disulfide isomerase/thioredoxin